MTPGAWVAGCAAAVAVAAAVPALPARPPPGRGGAAARAAPGPRGPRRDPSWRLRALVAASVGCGVLVLVGQLAGLLAAPLAAALAWHLAGRVEGRAVRLRRERLRADLPHVVDLMSACLAVGLAPTAALGRISAAMDGPVAEELDGLTARLDLGVDPATAWRDLGRHPQLGPLGRCLARSAESGAPVGEAMSRLAADLRRETHAEVEARARAVGVRAAVPLGVCLLPAFLLVGVVPLVAGAVPLVLGR